MSSYMRAALEQQAYRDWAAGQVIPYRITMALDQLELYGPEVDTACGVEEPAVDMWEAGTLYPTWEQLCALATLTETYPWAFAPHLGPAQPEPWTSLPFHIKGWKPTERVLAFTDEAIAAANLPKLPPPAGPPPQKPPPRGRRMRMAA